MASGLQLHDVVALLEDVPVRHFETGEPLLLRRGQIGTIVLAYDDEAFEVEFAGRDGRPYALLPIDPKMLMVLRDTPHYVAA